VQDPARIALLVHDDGILIPELERVYQTQLHHDPRDLDAARRMADAADRIYLGVFFRDPTRARYEEMRRVPPRTAEERIALLDTEFASYAV
jgi:hypothetical protein